MPIIRNRFAICQWREEKNAAGLLIVCQRADSGLCSLPHRPLLQGVTLWLLVGAGRLLLIVNHVIRFWRSGI
jgi:hypothetical protein